MVAFKLKINIRKNYRKNERLKRLFGENKSENVEWTQNEADQN